MQCVNEQAPASVSDDDPLTPQEVAAFLDGKLEGEELERVQARLAADSEARQEIIKTSRIVSTVPARDASRVSRTPYLVALAAAAAIAIIVVTPKMIERPVEGVALERNGAADHASGMDIVFPHEGDRVPAGTSFAWRAIPDATYHLVLQDMSGHRVLQLTTRDTAVKVPPLVKGATYYWSVDALRADGLSVTSGKTEFVISDN